MAYYMNVSPYVKHCTVGELTSVANFEPIFMGG